MAERGKPGRLATAALLAAAVVTAVAYPLYWNSSLVRVVHLPSVYSRRAGDFWAYVTGTTSRLSTGLEYRINDGSWRPVPQEGPRAARPYFTIEIPLEDLETGGNALGIRAHALLRPPEELALDFRYDPSPIELPARVDWARGAEPDSDLDSQDGFWETFETERGARVRPRPGYESYDRILAVTGAFPGGRRVETDVIFHGRVGDTEYGFGVLPMWGGHPDPSTYRPRRGWSFALAWYWDRYDGIGNEISYRLGGLAPDWVNSYRNLELEPDVRYRIVVECRPQVDGRGTHLRYHQALRWWPEGEPEPETWIELTDTEGAPLPPGEYAVALLAYNAVVDFGPVEVTRLEPLEQAPEEP